MIGVFIVLCEISFWIFILGGLFLRYKWRKKKLSIIVLSCTPLIDLLLLIFTYIDLKNGATATSLHGLAAVYIGVSLIYGHSMIQWADKQFSYRFMKKQKPEKRRLYGKEHASFERHGFYKHAASFLVSSLFILSLIFFIGNNSQTAGLASLLKYWGIILLIDFFISFSYTVWPRGKPRSKRISQ